MDTNQLIEELGGRSKVIEETGLTKGRIAQWVSEDAIPTPWLKYFQQKYKKIAWQLYQPMQRRTEDKKGN